MTRPLKQGLDYFPLDVNCDDKVRMIEAKHGISGFGILIKLWQIIYENGYFIKWTEREVLLYKNRINADINLINDVINECLKWELFNPSTYAAYGVLTSRGIQKRYLEAIKRRHEIVVYLDYWETEVPQDTDKFTVNIVQKTVNADNNQDNTDINPINSCTGTQSKERVKRKRKESISEESKVPFGEFACVKLTEEEHRKLLDKFGDRETAERIQRLDTGIASKGYKYKSHYATIISWAEKDKRLMTGTQQITEADRILKLVREG
jgi:hypothetical protein